MVTLLEARTFSPSRETPRPACGFFSEYRFSVRDLHASVAFWESQGFVTTEWREEPLPQVSLTSDGIDLNLYVSSRRENPALVFEVDDLEVAAGELRSAQLDVKVSDDLPRGVPALTVLAPEETPIVIVAGST